MSSKIAILLIMYIFGVISLAIAYILNSFSVHSFLIFILFYTLIFITYPPQRIISPLSIFYLYYGLWFIVAILFADRYSHIYTEADVLPEYSLAFLLVFTTFGCGVLAIGISNKIRIYPPKSKLKLKKYRGHALLILYILSTFLLMMIVMKSGGVSKWIADPGDAFLNRGGSGVYVILSHFSSMALAVLTGYYAHTYNKRKLLIIFIVWLLITSPIHGSKGQISTLLIISLIPWIYSVKFFSSKSYTLIITLVSIFFLGLYFRNHSWIDSNTFLPYAFNYFTTLENLAISLRDFEPDFIKTFFLPFVKFLTPFGLKDSTMYFDMNHFLTDIYYPTAWEIRATEQWPVETDLYLNFYFFMGLPLIFAYLFTINLIYRRALTINSLGLWFSAILLTLSLPSHLRGSLINHTDFYMYPYIFIIYFLFRKVALKTNE